MDDQVDIRFMDTPEKFYSMAEVVLKQVLELLKALSVLEREIFERNEKLEKDKEKAGIPYHQTAPGSKELWKEYSERYGQLVIPMCTEKLLRRGYAGSLGRPGKYDYLNTKCKIICMMKSAKKATVETCFYNGVETRQQFSVKNIDHEWKIDEIKYAFSNEPSWHADRI